MTAERIQAVIDSAPTPLRRQVALAADPTLADLVAKVTARPRALRSVLVARATTIVELLDDETVLDELARCDNRQRIQDAVAQHPLRTPVVHTGRCITCRTNRAVIAAVTVDDPGTPTGRARLLDGRLLDLTDSTTGGTRPGGVFTRPVCTDTVVAVLGAHAGAAWQQAFALLYTTRVDIPERRPYPANGHGWLWPLLAALDETTLLGVWDRLGPWGRLAVLAERRTAPIGTLVAAAPIPDVPAKGVDAVIGQMLRDHPELGTGERLRLLAHGDPRTAARFAAGDHVPPRPGEAAAAVSWHLAERHTLMIKTLNQAVTAGGDDIVQRTSHQGRFGEHDHIARPATGPVGEAVAALLAGSPAAATLTAGGLVGRCAWERLTGRLGTTDGEPFTVAVALIADFDGTVDELADTVTAVYV